MAETNSNSETSMKNKENTDCQLCGIYDAGTNTTGMDRAVNIHLRLASALRRRLRRIRGILKPQAGDDTGNSPVAPGQILFERFREGERVRVKTKAEIRGALDENSALNGLVFLLPMEEFCGGEYKIFKKVRRMYDERLEKMVRIRDAYILEGVYCNGRNVFGKEGCDRCCPFFWRSGWLERIP